MGYDFRAVKRGVDGFHLGAFSWPWMLDQGPGLLLGYGTGLKPGSYVYKANGGARGGSPVTNDGYRVGARDAKILARLLRELADVHDHRRRAFDAESEEWRNRVTALSSRDQVYKLPVRADFVAQMRGFAEWAERSGGFRVY